MGKERHVKNYVDNSIVIEASTQVTYTTAGLKSGQPLAGHSACQCRSVICPRVGRSYRSPHGTIRCHNLPNPKALRPSSTYTNLCSTRHRIRNARTMVSVHFVDHDGSGGARQGPWSGWCISLPLPYFYEDSCGARYKAPRPIPCTLLRFRPSLRPHPCMISRSRNVPSCTNDQVGDGTSEMDIFRRRAPSAVTLCFLP